MVGRIANPAYLSTFSNDGEPPRNLRTAFARRRGNGSNPLGSTLGICEFAGQMLGSSVRLGGFTVLIDTKLTPFRPIGETLCVYRPTEILDQFE